MASWAHVMWQNHGLRIEEFLNLPSEMRHLYIASEEVMVEERRKARMEREVR